MSVPPFLRRGTLALLAAASLGALAGCASTYRIQPERLIGAWQNRTVESGPPGSSTIAFRADGSFEEQRTRISASTGLPMRLQGTWTLVGDRLRLVYSAGFEGQGTPQVDNRIVSRLSESDFVSADIDYGREVWRVKVAPPKP